MAAGALLIWSGSAALTAAGTRALGVWPYVAMTTTLGGAVQLAYYGLARRSVRVCFALPVQLWLLTLFGFTLYGFVYPLSLWLSRTPAQLYGANLINYLWPVLTVLCALLWVPGTRGTWRLLLALALSLAGLALANRHALTTLTTPGQTSAGQHAGTPLPYLLAGIAALAWAVYSSVLARWRAWANRYATAPAGFLIVGAIAGGLALLTGRWPQLHGPDAMLAVLGGLGPCGTGYLLWELALHRVPAAVLGLWAAATPVLSTLLLSLVTRQWPDGALILGALLIACAAVLSVLNRPER